MPLTWEDASAAFGRILGLQQGMQEVDQARQNLGNACNNYVDNPTADNRAKVREEWQNYKNSEFEGTGSGLNNILPRPIRDALDLLRFNPFGDLIKGLDDKYNNTGDANADRVADMLRDLHKGEMDSMDKTRCLAAENYFKQSKTWQPPPISPLVLDLDGDGIETVAVGSGALFDHNSDGLKTQTGWVAADDGLLVLDRNGNGLIDNGGELFGDNTVLANGQKATDGFQALAELDSNGDGKVDAADATFQNLKVWRDIDQDGVSQTDEMFSLADVGVTSISLSKTTQTQNLGNGNQIFSTATFTRSNGTTSTIADVYFQGDKFNSEFVDSIPVSTAAEALPHMSGMGLVRNLSEAATLSSTLLGVLTQYAAATSVYDEKTLLDSLVSTWADTAVSPSQGVNSLLSG